MVLAAIAKASPPGDLPIRVSNEFMGAKFVSAALSPPISQLRVRHMSSLADVVEDQSFRYRVMSWYWAIPIFPFLTFFALVDVSRPYRVGESPTNFEAVTIAHFGFPVSFLLPVDELVIVKSDPFLPFSYSWLQTLKIVIS